MSEFDSRSGPPRLGVLATHPIQYQAPLYQELARRGRVALDVAFLSDPSARAHHDPGFGIHVEWDVDLLGGYHHRFLRRGLGRNPVRSLHRWIRGLDVLVIHGHAQPAMMAAAALAIATGCPYLMRGEAHPVGDATGWRRVARDAIAGQMVRRAAACLPIGSLNRDFYRRFGARRQFLAPYSVDHERFAAGATAAATDRARQLRDLGLPADRPVAVFAGKLTTRKRPLDLVAAIRALEGRLSLVMLGDGELRAAVESAARGLPIACIGFVNQSDLPRYYGLGDMFVLPSAAEPWGLVVNEGMAAGLLPVVSDRVGCAADLVAGLGEVFPAGDVPALAASLARASEEIRDPKIRARIASRIAPFSLQATAAGFEDAALAVAGKSTAVGRR